MQSKGVTGCRDVWRVVDFVTFHLLRQVCVTTDIGDAEESHLQGAKQDSEMLTCEIQ